jgi:hypothetical protein
MAHTSQNRLSGNISAKTPVRAGIDGGVQVPFDAPEEDKI